LQAIRVSEEEFLLVFQDRIESVIYDKGNAVAVCSTLV
jgi:hypothetical protein